MFIQKGFKWRRSAKQLGICADDVTASHKTCEPARHALLHGARAGVLSQFHAVQDIPQVIAAVAHQSHRLLLADPPTPWTVVLLFYTALRFHPLAIYFSLNFKCVACPLLLFLFS